MTSADRELRIRHERFLSDGARPDVRGVVADSWLRSAAAGVDAARSAVPTVFEHDELEEYRRSHALSAVFPLLYDVLGRAAEDCKHVMAVGDETGRLLWVCGATEVLNKVEDIRFVEGAWWDEAHAGTNAPGTALRLDAPVHIRTAEHFAVPVQQWSCAAAPIHDPETQRLIGVVDVTGSTDAASPMSLAMVRSAARMAEAELGRLHLLDQAGRLRRAVPTTDDAPITIEALGRADCEVRIDGHAVRLSQRHSEILVALVDSPEGSTADRLALEVYGESAPTSTIRAEIVRMRALLGRDIVRSRPYRLAVDVEADWRLVAHELEAGELNAALRSYRGPLLPYSDAPGVVERRTRLERTLRRAVLEAGQLDLLTSWTRTRWGTDDLEAWERQLHILPESSPLAAASRYEVERLRVEYGLAKIQHARLDR